jgi:DNA (cytosine-5)-methyltransferase 1
MKDKTLKAVDFFCGGGGMSYGMQQAGIKVLAGIDYEIKCKETYESNIKEAKFLHKNVFDLTESEIENELKISKNDDQLIMIGCSPCQYWSIINTDKNKSMQSKNLLIEFKRFVEYFNPGYVIVENVPGVLRKKEESGLENFITWLNKNEYTVHFEVHNVNDYGVPQSRKRFTLIANRVTKTEIYPIKKVGTKPTVRDFIGIKNGFENIKAGHKDITDFKHTAAGLTALNLKRLSVTPKNGGNRIAWSKDDLLQIPTYKNRDSIFLDSYGRLWWDRPSPTITTKFFSISNGRFAHPEENRALSLREGAVLQSFPTDYIFKTTCIADTARIIGNAVPPEYARRIGIAIIES